MWSFMVTYGFQDEETPRRQVRINAQNAVIALMIADERFSSSTGDKHWVDQIGCWVKVEFLGAPIYDS